MRFTVDILLGSPRIPKDKNRVMLSLIKHCLSEADPSYFKEMYEKGDVSPKNFTFSLYMHECKFHREEIEVPSQKMKLNISTYDLDFGLQLFNAMMRKNRWKFPYKEYSMTIGQVRLQREKVISSENVVFRALSPCVAREHRGDNKDTWFHSLSEERGREVFLSNLRAQAERVFPHSTEDISALSMKVIRNKEVKVKHYGIEVLGNIVMFELRGKTYLLDYFYKAGAGSMKSTGFSMLEIVDQGVSE